MTFLRQLKIGAKIQLAIFINVVLAALIGEYLVREWMGYTEGASVLVNLLINSFIAFIYGLFVSRAITRTLRRQIKMIRAISNGGGDLTQRLKADSEDEAGELSESFNDLMSHLQEILRKVAISVSSLSASIQYFNMMGDKISSGAEFQTRQTSHMVTEIEQLSSREQVIAESSSEAEEIAKSSETCARNGMEVIQQTIEGMNKVSSSVGESANTLEALKGSTDTIGNMVVTINEIADQTNLLALNAAIEAARAGEHGRGFAVVADEVRTLAVRTGEATKQINEMIEKIQRNMSDLIDVMSASITQVDEGVSLSNQAGLTLEEITRRSQSAASKVHVIAEGVSEQLKITNTIMTQVESIAEIAKKNGDSVAQVVSFSRELTDQMKVLQEVVDQFKL